MTKEFEEALVAAEKKLGWADRPAFFAAGWQSHVEAMKRIAGASPAALTDERIEGIRDAAIVIKGEYPNTAKALLEISDAIQLGGANDWRDQLAALVDIYDDAMNNPPESRTYVDGAFKQQMDEARALLAASPAALAVDWQHTLAEAREAVEERWEQSNTLHDHALLQRIDGLLDAAPADQGKRDAYERAYRHGWINSAKWANRIDLVADVDSPAYNKDRDEAMKLAMSATPPAAHKE